MIDANTQAPTPDTGTMGTTGTRSPKTPQNTVSNRVPVSGRVPVVPVVPISRVSSSLLEGVFGEAASEPEPTSKEEPLSASGGGEEQATTVDEADDGLWIIDAEASALLDELEEVDFDDVPICSCGRYCDVQTLDDAWHCSCCDPNAEDRRKRTSRLLATANRFRRENGLSESNVTRSNPQP